MSKRLSQESLKHRLRALYTQLGILRRMTDTTLVGRKLTGKRRRPKAIEGVRTCADSDCTTRLSRYNRKGTCHMHTPIKFPRVRGREAPAEA